MAATNCRSFSRQANLLQIELPPLSKIIDSKELISLNRRGIKRPAIGQNNYNNR